jgi:hypothetical protein
VAEHWHKIGPLLPAPTGQPWARSHAALPVAHTAGSDGFDLLYSARDGRNRAHIGRARVRTAGRALQVEGCDRDPVLAPGPLGAFDDCGVTSSCVVEEGDATLLYYTGWTLARSVPFLFFAGLAVSQDGGRSYERISPAPILERNSVDPFLTASPFVLRDGGMWRMWYVSCVRWEHVGSGAEPRHYYHLRYAESDDGVVWRRSGLVAIDFAHRDEYAIARPHVIKEGGRYRMWFCSRGEHYRLGYAESNDGISWTRTDEAAQLEPTPGTWDAEMVAYPHIVDAGGHRYLLYNGNGYGRTGVGAAIAVDTPGSAPGHG